MTLVCVLEYSEASLPVYFIFVSHFFWPQNRFIFLIKLLIFSAFWIFFPFQMKTDTFKSENKHSDSLQTDTDTPLRMSRVIVS